VIVEIGLTLVYGSRHRPDTGLYVDCGAAEEAAQREAKVAKTAAGAGPDRSRLKLSAGYRERERWV
jgi:hypothetical protein